MKLQVKAKGKSSRALSRTGRVKLKATIAFVPTGGERASQTRVVKLVKARRPRR